MLIDLDPEFIDEIKAGQYGRLFKPENFIVGQHGAGNNWARGHYSEGADLIDSVMDVIRKETESCECV